MDKELFKGIRAEAVMLRAAGYRGPIDLNVKLAAIMSRGAKGRFTFTPTGAGDSGDIEAGDTPDDTVRAMKECGLEPDDFLEEMYQFLAAGEFNFNNEGSHGTITVDLDRATIVSECIYGETVWVGEGAEPGPDADDAEYDNYETQYDGDPTTVKVHEFSHLKE